MLRGIWDDAKFNNSFHWKWGMIFGVLGLLFNIWLFMILGSVLLTLAICSELASEDDMNWNFGSNEGKTDEQTAQDQQGGPGTTDR